MTPTREEFLYISHSEQVLFYTLTYLSLAIAALQIWQRARLWMKGRPNWSPKRSFGASVKHWVEQVAKYVVAQRKVRSSRPKDGAPIHLAVFYGFLTLFIGTTLLAINSYSPIKFHFGAYYLTYEFVLDIMGLAFIVGLVWAFGRRLKQSSVAKSPVTTVPQDFLNLGLLFIVAITGFWLEAARMSVSPHDFDWSAPIGKLWSLAQGPISPSLYRFVWWFHMAWIWAFFAWLPRLRLRHLVLAIPSVALAPETPMGQLRTIPIEEVEETGKIGASEPSDLTKWQLLSADACMECGRCTEVCPAYGVGKELNPKAIVQGALAAAESGVSLLEKMSDEAIWACTTCNACVEACPVLIRQVDLIVDVRRNLVSEGKLSGSATAVLRGIGSVGHAWGKSDRESWMEGLDVPLARGGQPFEYLLWIGCAGSTDPGGIKTSRAVVQLLQKAGVSFACLGNEEKCTADPARRLGDEFTFQEKAVANVAVFQKYGIEKVVTPCPHCFNTLKNEYGEFGATLEVVHHTQLLAQMVADGRLKALNIEDGAVTLHDPCYLARVNGEESAPRQLLKGQIAEPQNRGRKTLCCGAGGGRMWFDEAPDARPSGRRLTELKQTGATTVAVGCPFCRIMLSGESQTGRAMEFQDLAELLLNSNENA